MFEEPDEHEASVSRNEQKEEGGLTYFDAGVDLEGAEEAVKRIKRLAESTRRPEVIGNIGSFSGFFNASFENMKDPVLVAAADGVGTKICIAKDMNCYDTIGIDLVAMCVNDIITCGAEPLFFLDYISTGKVNPEIIEGIMKGIVKGCKASGCALIGGETAEHPGVLEENHYDLAGFCVGIVDRGSIIDGSGIEAGDMIIGLGSSGLHSNGFSLVRRLIADDEYELDDRFREFHCCLGEELLTPTEIYVKPVLRLINRIEVKGIAHITGGGLMENIPRILPDNVDAQIYINSWAARPVFSFIQKAGQVSVEEMYKTFNMGLGMVLFVNASEAQNAMEMLTMSGCRPSIIGKVLSGSGGLQLFQ